MSAQESVLLYPRVTAGRSVSTTMVRKFPIQAASVVMWNSLLDYSEETRIVEKLGHLPVAIDQTGAYLNQLSKPLQAFLPLLKRISRQHLVRNHQQQSGSTARKRVSRCGRFHFRLPKQKTSKRETASEGIDADFLSHGLFEALTDGETTL